MVYLYHIYIENLQPYDSEKHYTLYVSFPAYFLGSFLNVFNRQCSLSIFCCLKQGRMYWEGCCFFLWELCIKHENVKWCVVVLLVFYSKGCDGIVRVVLWVGLGGNQGGHFESGTENLQVDMVYLWLILDFWDILKRDFDEGFQEIF